MIKWIYECAVILTTIEMMLILLALTLFGIYFVAIIINSVCKGLYSEFKFYKKTKAIRKMGNGDK